MQLERINSATLSLMQQFFENTAALAPNSHAEKENADG
jgi:hypothetical protein